MGKLQCKTYEFPLENVRFFNKKAPTLGARKKIQKVSFEKKFFFEDMIFGDKLVHQIATSQMTEEISNGSSSHLQKIAKNVSFPYKLC